MINQFRICQTILRQEPHLNNQVKSLVPMMSVARFSKAQDFFAKSQSRYQEHVKAFRDKVEKHERDNKPRVEKPFARGYSHPYNTDHHPLNFSPVKTAELFHDFIGPEQVSPHYENFLMSRKYAMAFWAGLLALSLGSATLDLHWIAQSALFPFVFWMQLMYFFLEWRKSLFKPLLVRFYRRVAANELYNFEVFYHENIELKIRELLAMTKSQLEFWDLHREFLDVKAQSINTFMSNEYSNLQRHINDRALDILKQAKSYEELNRNRILSNIVEEAVKEIDRQLAGPNQADIQRQMFESALEGLSKGAMEYAHDPILPLIQGYVKQNLEKYSNLSTEEQTKLVALSESQFQAIKESDRRARQEYLETEPKNLDSSLKSHEQVKRVLSGWGK